MSERTGIVLLAEDNPHDAEMMMHALRRDPSVPRIEWVRDGVEAIEFARSASRPRLLLLDLKMPRLDGVDVLRELKGDATTRAIPIVVVSSSSHERDVAECYRLGANGYLVKPVDVDAFDEAVAGFARYWFGLNRLPRA